MTHKQRDFRGLPPNLYTSESVWRLEVERIWKREWHCVARADQVPEVGDYLCVDHVGEPLVLIRGEDGVVRVLSRVCRHRAMLVLEGLGNTASIVCPYHSWSYELDGRLRAAPEMQRTPGFDRDRCRLPEIRSEIWQGFVFVNLDPDAEPLEPVMAGRDTYALDSDGPWSALRMPYRPGASPFVNGVHAGCGMPAIETLDPSQRDSVTVVHIFPGTKISLWGGHMDFYRMFPTGAAAFESEKNYCVPPALLERNDLDDMIQKIVDGFLEFRHEDDDLCLAVQRGLGSQFANPAPLCHLEGTINRFPRWVEQKLEIS